MKRTCGFTAVSLLVIDHKMIKSFALEGALDQGAWSHIEPDIECLQGQSIYHLSGEPVLLPHCPECKKHFPYIHSKSPLFYFETISPYSITTDAANESVPFLLIAPL